MTCKIIITQDHNGRRLDRTIRSIWPTLPLSLIMSSLRKGQVRLDAVRAREGGIKVCSGQELYVPWESPEIEEIKEENKKIKAGSQIKNKTVPILWNNEHVVIINKPVNLLVQPDVKGGDSVISRIWNMFYSKKMGFAPAAVHRLDRNTSGVLVAALSGEALRELERLFRDRLVHKRYLAVVNGEIPEKSRKLIINAPLLKDETCNIVTVNPNAGKSAKTICTRLTAQNGLSLVSIELLTGRTHQARVHMAHIGHPILGDRKYGNIEANRRWHEVKRPLLHAFELKFPENLSGALEEISGKTFQAKIPDDIFDIFDILNITHSEHSSLAAL